MRYASSLALLLLPLTASAGTLDAPVIGGSPSPDGKWPDCAALYFFGQQGCTGTLIAPNLVLTAGHCVNQDVPNSVMVGSVNETNPSQGTGESIGVTDHFEYPSSQSTIDVGLLVLGRDATVTPRAVASGWASFDIKNGTQVQLVGFGTTNKDGNVDSTVMMEAETTITDYNCTTSAGCNSGARPNGELGAGGGGIDTCPGDSGGPMYMETSYGTFVAGVTSRGYYSNQYYCSEGGIYERPDKIVQWIEETSGIKIKHGPEPTAEPITVVRGTPAETQIEVNDPKSESHTFEITAQPGYAMAAVNNEGVVRVCPQKEIVGGDTVKVTVTDSNDATRSLSITIPIDIQDGDPDDTCDVNAFGDLGGGGGGCCDTRRSASGSVPLALLVAFGLRRRRRAR